MLFFKSKDEVLLDDIINRLNMNMSNNYKDNAQANLKELEEALSTIKEKGTLKEKVLKKYETTLSEYQTRLKGYTHKDQTPYWT